MRKTNWITKINSINQCFAFLKELQEAFPVSMINVNVDRRLQTSLSNNLDDLSIEEIYVLTCEKQDYGFYVRFEMYIKNLRAALEFAKIKRYPTALATLSIYGSDSGTYKTTKQIIESFNIEPIKGGKRGNNK